MCKGRKLTHTGIIKIRECVFGDQPVKACIHGLHLPTKKFNIQDHENLTLELNPIQNSNLSEDFPASQ